LPGRLAPHLSAPRLPRKRSAARRFARSVATCEAPQRESEAGPAHPRFPTSRSTVVQHSTSHISRLM
jgi:hypothetical protein